MYGYSLGLLKRQSKKARTAEGVLRTAISSRRTPYAVRLTQLIQLEKFILLGRGVFREGLLNPLEGNAFFSEVLVDPAEKLGLFETDAFAQFHIRNKPEMHPLVVPIPINFRFFEIGAILVDPSGN
jgi:hypothetical protein